MKRLPALFVVILIILAGCGAREPAAVTIDRSFCCPVTIEQSGNRFSATLTVTPTQCAAVFSLPNAMKGFTLKCENDQITACYGKNRQETAVPNTQQCFLYWLDRALSQSEAAVSRKENTYSLQGAIDGRDYLLTIDRTTMKPLYFEIDSLDLTVKFQRAE